MKTPITITTTTPEHDQDGYWTYDMTLTVGETDHTIPCWKLATFLERGASADIDGSGLQLWGNSQPGGWRCLDGDSASTGKPSAGVDDEDESQIIVSNTNESITIPVPEGEDAEDFAERLQEEIDSAAESAEPAEPDAKAIWNELSREPMEGIPVRVGKAFGSREVFAAWESADEFTYEVADAENPCEELLEAVKAQFLEEFAHAIRREKED